MQFKTLIAAAFAATLGLASCANDEDLNPDSNKASGESTYASFSFTVGDAATRAEDPNADVVETTVNSVKVYVFSDGVLELATVPSLNRSVTEPVETTTGQKTIYLVTPAETTFENGFAPVVGTTTQSDFEAALTTAAKSTIAKDNAYLMAGGKQHVISKCTKEEAAANPVNITVTRSAAKMQLMVSPETEVRASINAAFAQFSFGIAQSSKTMYLLAGDNHFTARGEKVDGAYSNFETLPADYTGFYVDAVNEFCKDSDKSRYCGENFQQNDPVAGTTTFALIRSKVTPANIYNGGTLVDGTFYVIALHNPLTASWVFLQDDSNRQMYFASQADAENYITENNLNDGIEAGQPVWTVYEYKNGLCYYRLNITTDQDESHSLNQRFRVMRNTFYQATVTRIDALGAPNPGGVVPEDPDQPVEASAWLVCSIDIKPWTVCFMNNQVLQ